MQQMAVRCQSKTLHGTVNCVPGHYRPTQPIQVECMSSLCSLWKETSETIIRNFFVHFLLSGFLVLGMIWMAEIQCILSSDKMDYRQLQNEI